MIAHCPVCGRWFYLAPEFAPPGDPDKPIEARCEECRGGVPYGGLVPC